MTWTVTAIMEPDGKTALVNAQHTDAAGVVFSYGATVQIGEASQFVAAVTCALLAAFPQRSLGAAMASDIQEALTVVVP